MAAAGAGIARERGEPGRDLRPRGAGPSRPAPPHHGMDAREKVGASAAMPGMAGLASDA